MIYSRLDLEGRILNWWRYLAIARREMEIPSCLRRLTISWSVKGFSLFSFSIKSFIFDLIALDE